MSLSTALQLPEFPPSNEAPIKKAPQRKPQKPRELTVEERQAEILAAYDRVFGDNPNPDPYHICGDCPRCGNGLISKPDYNWPTPPRKKDENGDYIFNFEL